MVCVFTTLIVGHVSVTVLPLHTLGQCYCTIGNVQTVIGPAFGAACALGCGLACDSVAPGMCTPCGLMHMCFMSSSCGMMDFYYWSPYVFHRIAVLGFIV